jgi:SAM-dependent methyltransferase
MSDQRPGLYNDLHGGQLKSQAESNRHSAERILDILWEYIRPASVLDVGCGIGTWLNALQARELNDLRGIDGPWLHIAEIECNTALVEVRDLEAGFDLGRRFDLVICLEVAEHLSAATAERFVASLIRHAPGVLFSAAIPFQGGHHHVNEQFLSYWITLFAKHGYHPLDLIRGRIWNDEGVLWWLRQNIVLFADETLIASNAGLRSAARCSEAPVSVVHPDMYMSRIQELLKVLDQFKQVESFLREGGTFRSRITPQGVIDLQRLDQK